MTGKAVRELALPEFGNVSGIAYDIDADRGYATLASFTAPYKVYGFDGKSLEWKLVWQDDPPLDLSQIVATRVYVRARDGAKIPVFIVHRKDLQRDGANPTLLHVYGGFNNAVEPFYLGSYSAFVNRGGVFVDAGVRGGVGVRREVARAGDARAEADDVRRHDRRRRMADRASSTRRRRSSPSKAAATAG